jgi:hypothetical protein
VLAAGDRLVLRVRGNDDDQGVLAHDDAEDRDPARLSGTTTVHTGGAHDSYLLLPVIPA